MKSKTVSMMMNEKSADIMDWKLGNVGTCYTCGRGRDLERLFRGSGDRRLSWKHSGERGTRGWRCKGSKQLPFQRYSDPTIRGPNDPAAAEPSNRSFVAPRALPSRGIWPQIKRSQSNPRALQSLPQRLARSRDPSPTSGEPLTTTIRTRILRVERAEASRAKVAAALSELRALPRGNVANIPKLKLTRVDTGSQIIAECLLDNASSPREMRNRDGSSRKNEL